MIKTADWIIDLGPEAWPDLIRARATAAAKSSLRDRRRIVREKRSYTGAFLKPVLARRGAGGKKKRVEAAE